MTNKLHPHSRLTIVNTFIALAVTLGLCISAPTLAAPDASKILIAYYSRTGNTKAVCKSLAAALEVDTIEIKDLKNRTSKLGVAGGMFRTLFGMRTKIEPKTTDLTSYEIVILASPIWAAKITPALRTFIKSNTISGKKVILLTTSDTLLEEKYQQKNRTIISKAGGSVIGFFQIRAADTEGNVKIPRAQADIITDGVKHVPEIIKIIRQHIK
ncbi:MAG: hypothetical protein GY868_03875 [Deltaproteobacteria bacterium]|nr:hypothetical protein [Deltaproteobacteria bacterium]